MMDTSHISENIFTGYSGNNPCTQCRKRRSTLVGAVNQMFS